jgi:pimeloyl-ACP methyl ester carboxylesterase
MKSKVIRMLRMALLVYLGFAGLLFVLQRNMIFIPTRFSEEQGLALAAARGLERWEDDGVFHGWKDVGTGKGAVMVFHGNAGAAVHRDYIRDLFRNEEATAEFSVYIVEYPGYGFRAGRPGERAFREAALEAHNAISDRYETILLVGESIGSGTATWLAAERDAEGVLLITPFNRLSAAASHHYPWLPVRLLLRDRFRNDEHLEGFSGPVAFVVAGRDMVVPSRLGRKLYEGYDGPKLWRLQENADHNSVFFGPGNFWAEIMTFLLETPTAQALGE